LHPQLRLPLKQEFVRQEEQEISHRKTMFQNEWFIYQISNQITPFNED
jgi:hypothetical protein